MKNHQIRLPMSATNKWWSTLWCLDYGTGNKKLICNLLSQHRWWNILHFAFMLGFQEKPCSLCECFILKSVDLCMNFSVCILPVHKIVPNSWTLSAPSVCTFYHGWNVTIIFRSLHFVSLGLCSWGSDSRLRNLMKISLQGKAKAPLYNSLKKSIGLLIVWTQLLLKILQACNLYKLG